MSDFTASDALAALDYDPQSGVFRFRASRGRRKAGDVAGYVKADGYRMIHVGDKWRYAHRLAWLVSTGSWPEAEIDHINGQRDDNRLANLRAATRSENMRNVPSNKGWHRKGTRWQALIRINGERKYLGTFSTERDAQTTYEQAAQKLHGVFAKPAKQEAMI